MNVIERIMAHAERLTSTERKIAEVLAGEPQAVAFGTVAQVASRAGTSGPSVVRLAVKLEYEGFVDLQADVQAELARQLGAAHVINAATTDPVAAIEELGGADVAIVPASDPKMVEQANASLRRGGLLILVSLPTDITMALPVYQTVLNGIRVVGSIVGTRPAACLPTASRSVPLS